MVNTEKIERMIDKVLYDRMGTMPSDLIDYYSYIYFVIDEYHLVVKVYVVIDRKRLHVFTIKMLYENDQLKVEEVE
ncbi:hypothetical protein [Saccharolobus solfataricus]|uniref:hypothetical protein n=1 Tax=Saccharolobus solfataricus TaxID=2287 RepID=UPI0001C3955B